MLDMVHFTTSRLSPYFFSPSPCLIVSQFTFGTSGEAEVRVPLSQRVMYLGDLLKVRLHSDSHCGASGSFLHIPFSAWRLFLFLRTHPLR